MLPSMVCGWGIVCTLTGLVQDYHGLIALRLMLGLVEGGLVSASFCIRVWGQFPDASKQLPGLVLYLRCVRALHLAATPSAD